MKVFITGATGVLGKRVVKLLTEKNIAVVALSRSANNSLFLKQQGVETIEADLFNANEMIEATKNCNAIFHLATHIPKKPIPDKPSDWAENDKIRTTGTRNLIQAAVANNIKCFIQQSITFIYGQQNGAVVTSETHIPDEQIGMLKSAVEMENIIRNEKDTDYIVLRFGSFYSADSYNTQNLVDSVRKRKIPIIGKGDFYWNLISVDDASDAIVYSFQNFRRLKNKTINFTDFFPMLFKDIVNGLAHLTQSKKPFAMPAFLAKLFIDKNMYAFITNSCKVQQDDIVKDWQPKYKNFLDGMKVILSDRNFASG